MLPSLPHMAPAAIARRGLLLILDGFFVAADALLMISLFEIQSRFWPVASGALNLLAALCQFAFVQDIVAFFIEMVAILAGQSLLGMKVMWKDDRRPFFPWPAFG